MKPDLSIYCPFCRKHTALTIADASWGGESYGSSISVTRKGKWWIGVCNSCENAVLVHEVKNDFGKYFVADIFPYPLPKPIDERVPDFIKSDLMEAYQCVSIGAYRGAAVLARRILQVICLEKGANPKSSLVEQIDELASKAIITRDIAEWAHSVRWVGNNAAHPSTSQENIVEKEDAEEILELVDQIIHILYIAGSIAKEKMKKFAPPK